MVKRHAVLLLMLGVSAQARNKNAPILVHCWDNIRNLNAHSLLGLSTLNNAKCYVKCYVKCSPTMTKNRSQGREEQVRRLATPAQGKAI